MEMKMFIDVRRIVDDEIVHSVDITGKSYSQIERIEMGMNINLDADKYYTDIETRKEIPNED